VEGRALLKYTVVLEYDPGENDWGAYVPDLPGCVAVGDTREEVEQLIRDAITMHLESMLSQGEQIPPRGTWTIEVEIDPDRLAAAPHGHNIEA
jgi:predicted RNase H-like HicB family nuclease